MASLAQLARPRRRPRGAPAYRRLLVPLEGDGGPADAVDFACRLAADEHAVVSTVTVIEVPLDLPFAAPLPDAEGLAREAGGRARAIGEAYGIAVRPRTVRARSAGPAILHEIRGRRAEVVVLSVGPQLGATAEFVLRNAPCRVLLLAPRPERPAAA